nr:chloride channel protein [uncultured Sphingomonas sp.]
MARRAHVPLNDWRRRLATVVGAVLLGLVALVFAKAGDVAQHLFAMVVHQIWWLPIILTPAIFAGVAWVTVRFVPEARGSGIPQVIAASRSPTSKASATLVSLKAGFAKLLLTLAILLGGGSAGREGPTVQVSASIMVAVHRWLKVKLTPGVLIAGGAAGVAAAFNTPLAGIAFAIEELAAKYEQRVAVIVMGAVMIAGMVSLGIAGDYVYFGRMGQVLGVRDTLLVAPVAGVVGGLLGGLFTRIVLGHARNSRPLFRAMKQKPIIAAASCGLLVAIIGIASGGLSWGTGYEPTRALLEGHDVSIWFGPAKFGAALATTLSGTPGGIFAPSLAVGAGLGNLLAGVFSNIPAEPVVLLGMIAYFVGVVRAPFTAVIIVSEATGNHGAILSLFATALIADWASARISPSRLYHGLSEAFLPRSPAKS